MYVCEYDGITWSIEGGYQRVWSDYIKDGTAEEQIILATADDGGAVELNLHFFSEILYGRVLHAGRRALCAINDR